MSDELLRGAARLRTSMERAIRQQLGRLPWEDVKSPSDVLALLRADRARIVEDGTTLEAER